MLVTLHTKEIRIVVEEGTLNHLIITNFVKKYFSNTLMLSETIVIFHKEGELSQKNYFLQWLYAAYSKKRAGVTPAFLKSLKSSVSFPIRVRITGKKRPVQAITIEIVYRDKNSFELKVTPLHSSALNYLRFRFRAFLLESHDGLVVETNSETIKLLDGLIARKTLLAQPIVYRYRKIDLMKIYEQHNREQREQKHHFYNLIIEDDSKVVEAYRVLGCDRNTPKEEIKRIYRRLAFKYHPDRASQDDKLEIARKTEMFHKIHSAYELVRE